MQAVAAWIAANADIRRLAARVADRPGTAARAEAAAEVRDGWISDFGSLLIELRAGPEAALTADGLRTLDVEVVTARLRAWLEGDEHPLTWVD